ncbi:pyridoxal 5'-phosphate synthase glutaminase subunit PdxT [Caldicellulosiruptor changbaiensis]|uniref:Pyridoxal 5'-phosphate synthase subunit PdxT n=1 Tax=Caldicellulosiruptor changbaiensis TaxID=1222016 RepID=A0A3T0D707_9FIRM|nr:MULTISPECIES: pyridoxal 5'-phosphate synthase glutaminase subunit PdxT [Caldicellulosiruptor]AZT90885.1 pyridoxal 5'-phosphate synthase glutaminase subunit PdxT [Caldicellulosiruptor changbaiensis]
MKKIGVLAFQGGVIEHVKKIEEIGHIPVLVKKIEDLDGIDGLILPGGESTTIGKFLIETGVKEKILSLAEQGMPMWGTCAGAILLSKTIKNQGSGVLPLLDIVIERNAYGSQLDSFKKEVFVLRFNKTTECVFIRAPKIVDVGSNVEVLAQLDTPIAVLQGTILATTFHPELTSQNYWHSFFVENVIK